MSESERRRGYAYNRVLIESDRILDPQFDDAVVFLSGAQIEMLRNVTQYLNRLDTYVSEGFLGYYLTPDIADFDDILEIVADLEETLMGNPNTIWGYKDTYTDAESVIGVAGTIETIDFDPCPEGSVYVLTNVHMYNSSGTSGIQRIKVISGAHETLLLEEFTVVANHNTLWQGRVEMKEDDFVRIVFKTITIGDNVHGYVKGSEMAVPVE